MGEETPVRVIDAGAQLQGGQREDSRSTLPVATVDYKETGVILEVTPRITGGNAVILDLSARAVVRGPGSFGCGRGLSKTEGPSPESWSETARRR